MDLVCKAELGLQTETLCRQIKKPSLLQYHRQIRRSFRSESQCQHGRKRQLQPHALPGRPGISSPALASLSAPPRLHLAPVLTWRRPSAASDTFASGKKPQSWGIWSIFCLRDSSHALVPASPWAPLFGGAGGTRQPDPAQRRGPPADPLGSPGWPRATGGATQERGASSASLTSRDTKLPFPEQRQPPHFLLQPFLTQPAPSAGAAGQLGANRLQGG